MLDIKYIYRNKIIIVLAFFIVIMVGCEKQIDHSQKEPIEIDSIYIGDYIEFGSYLNEPILWRVIDLDEEGNPIIFSHKIITFKVFDSFGEYHENEHRYYLGSNYWKDSNIRQWLNSSEEKIQWIQNEPKRVSGSNEYANKSGFLSDKNFTQKERNAIKTREHKSILHSLDIEEKDGGVELYRTNTNGNINDVVQNYDSAYYQVVKDRVFFLSTKEVKELVYDRGWDVRGKPTEKAERLGGRRGRNGHMSYMLRTPKADKRHTEISVRIVDPNGFITEGNVGDEGTMGVRPALKLNIEKTEFIGGIGSKGQPYIFKKN